MKKKPIICFMGLDGSGKSTCIKYAHDELKKRGIDVEIVRAAYVVKFLAFAVKLGKKILLNKNCNPYSGDYKAYLENMRNKANKGAVYKIFSFLTTCEFKLQIFFNIRLKHLLGKTLLVDRYIYDNAVTYAANLGLSEEYMRETVEKKWKHSPKPDLIIYIRTEVEICCSRKNDIPDPLYLKIREPLYNLISTMYPTKIIWGSQDKGKMLAEVMEEINKIV